MPELPEVETVTRSLQKSLLNNKVTKWTIRRPNLRYPIPQKILKNHCINQKPSQISRRGKFIHMEFKEHTLQIHLGMSGVFLITKDPRPPRNHTHITIEVDNGKSYVHYIDPRRFGFVLSFPNHKELLSDMGPEPLEGSLPSLVSHMIHKSEGKRSPIKTFLLNQNNIAGLGNIYVCEALFLAGIHPETAAGLLNTEQWKSLTKAIRSVLKKGIKAGGTTLKDFHAPDENPGYFQQTLNVYGQEGRECSICKAEIIKITLSGRSTFYCPKCQR